MRKFRLRDIDLPDRPREKLLARGVGSLTDTELAAVVIGTGIKGHDVIQTAAKLVRELRVSKDDVGLEKIMKIPGIGNAQAMRILSALELAVRLLDRTDLIERVCDPEDAVKLCRGIRDLKQETLVALYLDARSCLLAKRTVTRGSANFNIVHPRELFAPALELNAISVILAHNHPSGDMNPSEDDVKVSHRLVKAGKILGIEVLDHLVLARNGWVSMKEAGLFDSSFQTN